MRKILCLFISGVLFLTILQFCAGAVSVSAQSAVLLEAETGTVLYEQNADQRLPMASTTKIMTAVTVIENSSLCETVTVSAKAASTEGSSMYLKSGEKISVLELLYGLMLSSGNDAATALAEFVGGSEEGFAEMMNETAEKVGLHASHFVTASGLDNESHYTTARDMGVLTQYALKNELFRSIVSTKSITVGEDETPHYLTNHNRLLSRYKYCIGVKTGYTSSSGRCLVSAAEKDGVTLIAVTLNDRNDWNDHIEMLDYGFTQAFYATYNEEAESFSVPIAGGGELSVTEFKPFGKVMFGKDSCTVTRIIELPHFVYAPVFMGTVIGYSNYYIDGQLEESIEILADTDVGGKIKLSLFDRIAKWFADVLLSERNKHYGKQ